ncbi:flagellar hook-associated protein FlgK [Sphingomonas ginsenosidivorax]|uniref:Flagellar hook-associated protein 1 n=1 Tax=Sphingomonas ginsenosidivorax TaxID=862135 RepID=A0A5C6UI38_9SPHN|nr:flagellar hook-associated protein FlgK [Sphingomonas ginsenosidivorax]TXC72463.1 flagellar hook-associated protein FlgK [Sphingomonas ginsenosidivorax]
MSDLLSIGASGVNAYQSALSTVSENIANTGVAGYSRRTVSLKEVGAAGTSLTSTALNSGSGVVATGINRAADAFRNAAVRSSSADLARTEAGSTWLDGIQSALTGNKLGTQLTSFFNSATALAADPTSTASRATMLEGATSLAAAFTATGTALGTVATTLDATATQATQSLGALGAALAKVNDGLARTQAGTGAAAGLADQRDQLLEQMSAIVDVSATMDSAGRATVKVGGDSGPVLVAGNEAGSVAYERSATGQVSFAVIRAGTVASMTPSGGALAGIADGAQRVADATEALGDLATSFTSQVNAVQAQGRDLDGNAGTALFATGGSPLDIRVALTDPRGIAAASATGSARDASNLAALQAVRVSGGFEAGNTAVIATNAAALAQRKTVADAQGAIRDGAISARDGVSGVSLDNEAVDLMRFQQAYQASSRIIQVARETFQSILQIQ